VAEARAAHSWRFTSPSEVERYEDTYNQLKKIDDARALAW
jgi:hypothetical protein